MYKFVTFSRQELFNQVWTRPLLKLASTIGVSDVALGKACRKAKIPLPGRGYWAGERSARRRPELSPIADCTKDVIEFRVLAVKPPQRPSPEPLMLFEPRQISASGAIERLAPTEDPPPTPAAAEILVSDVLTRPHPLILVTRRLIGTSRKQELLSLNFKEGLLLKINRLSVDRTLRMMDTLIKASERQGCAWRVDPKGMTIVRCDNEDLKFIVSERHTRRERPKPEPRATKRGAYPPSYEWAYYPPYEWIPTGQLTLRIDAVFVNEVVRYVMQPRAQTLSWRVTFDLG